MTRTELAEKICNAVISGEKLTKEEMKLRSKCNNDSYKSGLYFLYNDLNECIYVGQTGNGEYASLYMRMVGNGDAAHKKDSWNNEVSYGYWHKFNITDEELLVVERFSIIGMHQPIYNDKFTDQSTVDAIKSSLRY